MRAGYFTATLVAARIVWGIVGGANARFTQFIRPPSKVAGYLSDVVKGREARYLGHNPAGAVMILILLLLLSAISVSGWLLTIDLFWGSTAMERIHGVLVDAAIICIVVHVSGVITMCIRQRENLISSMITGRKRPPGAGDVE